MTAIGIFGVPTNEFGTSAGAQYGPGALRSNGLIQYLNREGIDTEDHGDVKVDSLGDITDKFMRFNNLSKDVNFMSDYIRSQKRIPVLLGGDHAVVHGGVYSSCVHHPNVGLLWIDAHADMNVPSTSPSGNLHGMVLSSILGLRDIYRPVSMFGFHPRQLISPERVAIIGPRSIDRWEKVIIRNSGVRIYDDAYLRAFSAAETVRDAIKYLILNGADSIHISVDLDVLNPEYAPGVSTPEPGGLFPDDLWMMTDIAAHILPLTGMDVVEFTPPRDPAAKTLKAAFNMLKWTFTTM